MSDGFILELAAILILPMLPAFVLYKLLPSKTHVSGPFRDLQISLTGAFGGYFLLVVVAAGHAVYRAEAEKATAEAQSFPRYEEWILEGTLEFSDPSGAVLSPDKTLLTFAFQPDPGQPHPLQQDNTMNFTARVPAQRFPDGSYEFPFRSVVFEHDGFHVGQFYLQQDDPMATLPRKPDQRTKHIMIESNVLLEAKVEEVHVERTAANAEK